MKREALEELIKHPGEVIHEKVLRQNTFWDSKCLRDNTSILLSLTPSPLILIAICQFEDGMRGLLLELQLLTICIYIVGKKKPPSGRIIHWLT